MTDTDPQPAQPTPRDYGKTLFALMVLLGLTCAAAFIDFDRLLPGGFWPVAIAFTIAAAKALLILMFFMHAKFGPRRVWVFAGAGFLWLGILSVLTFCDYLTRNHPPGQSPKGEPQHVMPAQS
jgi:cytochrome c oxidase subunit 4